MVHLALYYKEEAWFDQRFSLASIIEEAWFDQWFSLISFVEEAWIGSEQWQFFFNRYR